MAKLLRLLSAYVLVLLLANYGSIFAEPKSNPAKNKKKMRAAEAGNKKATVVKNNEKSEVEKTIDSLRTDNYTGHTKLMDALEKKLPLEVVQYLVEVKKEDVNAIDSEMLHLFKPVLRYAIDRGTDAESIAIIRLLLDSGAQVRGVDTKDTKAHHYGFMPLFSYAVAYSSPEVVQLLIDYGVDVNPALEKYKGYNAHLPLCLAYQLEKPEVVEILKKAGAKEGCCSWWDRLVYKIKRFFRFY
jgi:ankyrin repeat protein